MIEGDINPLSFRNGGQSMESLCKLKEGNAKNVANH